MASIVSLTMTQKKTISPDTSTDIERRTMAIYRDMPAWRKLQLVDDANRTARQLAFAGLRLRHPDDPLSKLRRRLLGLVHGETTATRIYGPLDKHSR